MTGTSNSHIISSNEQRQMSTDNLIVCSEKLSFPLKSRTWQENLLSPLLYFKTFARKTKAKNTKRMQILTVEVKLSLFEDDMKLKCF